MRLFHYRAGTGEAPVPGLADLAAVQRWQPAPDQPFDRDLTVALYEMTCDMYGVPRGLFGQDVGRSWRGTSFRDRFCLTDAGRTVTVTNMRAILGPEARLVPGPPKDVAVCAVALPALLAPGCVQPRAYPNLSRLRPQPVGNPEFDERFLVAMLPVPGGSWLAPQVQQVLLAHEDWVLTALGTTLACLTRGAFTTTDDVLRRIRDVLELVAAIPPELVPDHTDSSADDLAARIARISSVDDAVAFLQQLTDADRDRLARSDSPLALFADVRTPEEAIGRFQSLDPARQMQLMAQFLRADGGR